MKYRTPISVSGNYQVSGTEYQVPGMTMVTKPGEASEEYKGVSLRRFRPDRKLVWGNFADRPPNARYYQWGPSGLMNLTILFGTDIYVSLPHFLDCDPQLLEAVDGLNRLRNGEIFYG